MIWVLLVIAYFVVGSLLAGVLIGIDEDLVCVAPLFVGFWPLAIPGAIVACAIVLVVHVGVLLSQKVKSWFGR
jgi:hypothetical protein